jgi:hypothetical protein
MTIRNAEDDVSAGSTLHKARHLYGYDAVHESYDRLKGGNGGETISTRQARLADPRYRPMRVLYGCP